ncbi:MAG: lipopolysaccharide biosynthesis protein [Candidatus Methylomirabilales bacterium]
MMLQQEVHRRIARGSVLSFLSSLLSRGFSMAHSIVVARWLDPYRVGLFSLLNYVLGVAGALSDLGLPAAAVKLIAEEEARGKKGLKSLLITLSTVMLLTAGLTGLLLVVLSDRLAALYREPSLAFLFKVGAVLLVLSLLGGLLGGILQGVQRIEVLAVLGPAKGLTAFLALLLLLPSFGLLGILMASMAAEIMGGLLAARPLRQALSFCSGEPGRFAWSPLHRAFSLSFPIFLNGLLLWGTPWLVRSFLASTRGYQEVGVFQVADSFSRLLLLIPTAVAVPLLPAIAFSSTTSPAQASGVAQMTFRSTLLVTLPPARFFFLAAQPLVGFVYGSPYAEAGSLAAFLIMAVFFQSLGVILWSVLVGTGRVWAGLLIQLTSHMTLLALTFTLVPPFGLTGLGMAHLVASGLGLLLALTYTRTKLEIDLASSRALLPLSLGGWLVAWGLYVTGKDGILQALLLAGGMLVWEGRRLTEEERSGLNGWIRRMPLWRAER